jgi:hypothetical protein
MIVGTRKNADLKTAVLRELCELQCSTLPTIEVTWGLGLMLLEMALGRPTAVWSHRG